MQFNNKTKVFVPKNKKLLFELPGEHLFVPNNFRTSLLEKIKGFTCLKCATHSHQEIMRKITSIVIDLIIDECDQRDIRIIFDTFQDLNEFDMVLFNRFRKIHQEFNNVIKVIYVTCSDISLCENHVQQKLMDIKMDIIFHNRMI
jgi:hypothetical protein